MRSVIVIEATAQPTTTFLQPARTQVASGLLAQAGRPAGGHWRDDKERHHRQALCRSPLCSAGARVALVQAPTARVEAGRRRSTSSPTASAAICANADARQRQRREGCADLSRMRRGHALAARQQGLQRRPTGAPDTRGWPHSGNPRSGQLQTRHPLRQETLRRPSPHRERHRRFKGFRLVATPNDKRALNCLSGSALHSHRILTLDWVCTIRQPNFIRYPSSLGYAGGRLAHCEKPTVHPYLRLSSRSAVRQISKTPHLTSSSCDSVENQTSKTAERS